MGVRRYTRYTAKEAITSLFPFSCAYCGCVADMAVTETATSTREVGGHGHGEEERARNFAQASEQAKKTAANLAKNTAGLVPCPSCRRRDDKKVRWHVITTIFWSIFCLALGGGLAYVAATATFDGTGRILLGIFGVLAVIVGLALPFSAKKTYDTAPSKAQFANVRAGVAAGAVVRG